jgi:hypothetical protein
LRLWEIEHPVEKISNSASENLPSGISLVAPDDGDIFDEGVVENGSDNSFQSFEMGEPVDFGNQRPFLLRGDLVELRYGLSCIPYFHVFLHDHTDRHQ